jgi:hypothetical protein
MTLRLTLEIVPFGVEANKRVIETVNISNIGEGPMIGSYYYIVEHNDYKNYDDNTPQLLHWRKDGALVLAQRALELLNFKEDENECEQDN